MKKDRSIMRKWLKSHPMLSLLLSALLMEFILETLFRHTPVKALLFVVRKPHLFILNVLIVYSTYCISAPFRKRRAIVWTITLLWLTFGITNFILSLYRQLPFTMVDVLLVRALFSLLDVYFTPFQIILMFAALIGVAVAIVLLFIKSRPLPRLPWSQWLPAVVAPAMLSLLLCMLFISNGMLDFQFLNLYESYQNNGFAYCFVCTFADVGMKQPRSYSPESITQLDENVFSSGRSGHESVEQPNILYLQLESFFDLNQVIGLDLDEDPAPNYTRLKAEYPSGLLYVPVCGGGTVNTEMEIVTGMNINFFGAGEYPYYTILREVCCESLAYDLKSLGYTPTAIHNNNGSFYSRHEVYARLGFDRYDSVEYMQNVEKNPIGWAKDAVLEGEIMEALTSTEGRDFVFTVAVQSHGSYPNEPDLGHTLIELGAGEEGINPYSLEYYSHQVHEVDAFLGSLVNTLSTFDEPVVLVVYGDHLPSLNLTGDMLTTGDLFATEYVIWSNSGLDGPDEDLEAFQLTAHMLDMIGYHCGTMFYFHQNQADSPTYLDDMHMLQYDMLYGDHSIYGGEMPYEITDLHMGLRPIVMDSARMQYGYLSVTGSGFTPCSRVCADDAILDTLFISPTQLVVPAYEPTGEERITVGQVSDDQIILSHTPALGIEQ